MLIEPAPEHIEVQPYDHWRADIVVDDECLYRCGCCIDQAHPDGSDPSGCEACGGEGWLYFDAADEEEEGEWGAARRVDYRAYVIEVAELIKKLCLIRRWDFMAAMGQFIKSGGGRPNA